MTLETILAQQLSDHSNLQPTSLGWVNSMTQLISYLVSIYACPYHHDLLHEILLTISVLAFPLNVQASQSSALAPVEVSWSPPSGGTVSITNYRIFYGNGQNVSVAPIFTGVALNINKDAVGETVSIRSEADQLTSELISVTITGKMKLVKLKL